MSCFGGRMQEYDRVSLDRFDGKNLQSTVYFLSHLHEDHTAGLGEKIFLKRLKSNKDIFLYCSEVTQVLLVASKKYHRLKPFIRGLSINTPTTIVIPDPLYEEKEKITVTLLPAFHCPGSVMFLIEGKEGTVLYTGDFRWEHFNIEQMHHLRSGESVKKIKSLYIDTTFCTPENLHIPSRQQCIDAVCQLVHEWTSISPKHVVRIYLRAQYGHEPLLNAVASRLNKKIHVNAHKVSVYNRIQEFHGNFTTDGINTQLHACDKDCMIDVEGEEILCREAHDADKVLAILPTTMYFTQFQHLTLDKIVKKINSNFFRACYSFHSSYTEVKDLLSYLKPERVFPNVKTPSDSSLAVTQHRLNTMLKECLESGAGEVIQSEEAKELGTLKTRSGRQVKKRKGRESTSEADSLDFGTPVKTARYSLSCSMESGEPASPSESSSTGTRKGRGRGRGRGKAETASQPVIGTRRSTRRSSATPTLEETTPKKSKESERSPTPDLFLTPASDTSDQHSSFCGSERSDSELSLFSSQKSLDLAASGEAANSWTAGSFLAAVSSSSEDDTTAGRHCLLDDEEQTDEQFEDCSKFSDTEEEEEGHNLEQLDSVVPPENLHGGADNTLTRGAVKSKGTTKSPVKRGKRGKKGKVTTKSTCDLEDAVCKELNTEEFVVDNKGCDSDQKADLKLQISAESGDNQFEVSDTVVNEKDKNSLLPDAEVRKLDTEKTVSETDDDLKGINTDKMNVVVDSIKDISAAQRLDSFEVALNPEALAEIDSWSENISDEPVNDENVLKYLGTPIQTEEESTSSAIETDSKKVVEAKENTTKDIDAIDEENVENVLESSEDLHLHLSETTHGSEENSNESNMGSKNDKGCEIVIIDSDSVDSIDGVKRDTSTEVCENDRHFESKLSIETVSHLNGSSSEIAVMIVDSDSNEVSINDLDTVHNEKQDGKNITSVKEKEKDIIVCVTDAEISINGDGCSFEQEKEVHRKEKDAATNRDDLKVEEHKAPRFDGVEQDLSNTDEGSTKYELMKCAVEDEHVGKENVKNGTDIIKLVDKDQVEEAVQIVSVESTKPEISSKQKVDMDGSITTPDVDLTENKLISEDDDDVIEIVDLTGNELTGQSENQDTSKSGKKTIKISLLTKTESLRKVKKKTEDKLDVFEREKTEDTDNDNESDLDDINEISSSPEWLSVKRASGQKKRYNAVKEKKAKTSTLNKSKNSDNKIREVKDNKSNESASDLDKSAELSEKELDERAEVRRQAVGFMCDTDSESDTDESSDPGSPEADMLYDDYVELSSDSDNEGGIGGKCKGGKAPGRKSKNFRGKGDARNGSNGKSGNTAQGWLTSRKHSDLIESAIQDTVTDISDLKTREDIQMAERTVREIQQGPNVNEIRESGMDTNQTDQSIAQDVNVPDQETSVQTGERNDQEKIEEKNNQTKQGIGQTQIDTDKDTEAIQDIRFTENSGIEIAQKTQVTKTDNICLNPSSNPKDTASNQDISLQAFESDKIVETVKEPPKMETGNITNQSDEVLDKECVSVQVTTEGTVEEEEERKIESNVQDLTVAAVDKSTLKTGKNSEKRDEDKGNGLASDEGCIKTGEKNDLTENANIETVKEFQQLVPAETSKESIQDLDAHLLDFVPRQLKKGQGEKKVLQSDKEEKKGTDKVVTEQNSDKDEKKSDVGKTSLIEPSRETYKGFPNKKDFVSPSGSASLESNKATGESNKLPKSKKVIDWRKLPPANVSKVSDKITSSDQPVAPGSVSATLESNKATDEGKKLPKSKKVIDWRKLPPANVDKVSANVSKVSNKKSSDQPAPPGTEDPPSLKEESKKISSVVSTSRPMKTYLYNTNVPVMPLPAAAVQRPLYNLFVAGAAPTHIPPPGIGPPYDYKYSKSAPPQQIPHYLPPQVPHYPPPQVQNYPSPQIPNYAPPGWVQYPYRPPPRVPFPLPTAFTQPPPSVPYSKVVPTPGVSLPATSVSTTASLPTKPVVSVPVKVTRVPTTVKLTTNPRVSRPEKVARVPTTVKSTTHSRFSPAITVTSTVQSVNTTVNKAHYSVANVTQSTASKWSASSIPESTRTVTVTCAKSKKLSRWQQEKVDIFDRGPSCIAKKEVKPKININIGKTPSQKRKLDTPPISEEQSQNQMTSVDDLTRLSQQGFQQRPASMDLAAIKANISALTGLPVANTTSVPANLEENQPEGEDLPALVEKLKRLEKVQALLEAVNTHQPAHENIRKETTDPPKETFQYGNYGNSQHVGYNDPIKEEYYDSRGTKRDRLSIDDEYESRKRRRSYEYEGRERDDDGRYRSRDYTDYEGRERSRVDYDRRDYEKKERNVERLDRDYLEYRESKRDVTFERRGRDYEAYERDRNLDYERREREREFERRYREEEEYRSWAEERRRREESYRGGRRASPSRYPDDADPYYDRRLPPRPREARYEEWLERRHGETHSRVRHDSYERYDDQPTAGPRSRSVYEYQPRIPQGQPEASVDWNTYDRNDLGRQEYGTEMRQEYGTEISTQQEGLPEARTVQRPPYTESARNPFMDPYKKKPIMARVLSRSGQVLSVQSGWQSAGHTQTATAPDMKQEGTDVPVFLTGMKYYGSPTDTT